MGFSKSDHIFMARAIKLAQKGQFTTSPNPNVGCVVVKNGEVIAEGWHQQAGQGHAEVNAFFQLSESQAVNSTVYVTLEPCSHYGRTPPCAELLVNAKVARVVIANLDPNPLVSGKGVKLLEQAGIKVESGLLADDAWQLNEGFFTRMRNKRPFVRVKMAASLDGKIALANGKSKWITGSQARADVQTYRAKSCAVLSTATTVLADNANLAVRSTELNFDYPSAKIRQPLKIILDGKNRITESMVTKLKLFDDNAKVILVQSKPQVFQSDDIQSIELRYDNGFDLPQLLNWCGSNEINHLWVEAGGELAASFIEQALMDELVYYIAPKVLGADGKNVFPIGPFEEMAQVVNLDLANIVQLENDIKLIYRSNK